MAGSASLTLDQAVSLDRCYAALLPLTAGRPAVLQISSYHALNDETYPSMFFAPRCRRGAWANWSGRRWPARSSFSR